MEMGVIVLRVKNLLYSRIMAEKEESQLVLNLAIVEGCKAELTCHN